jgi:glycosyltransferase involved in cell wall biosynthesis
MRVSYGGPPLALALVLALASALPAGGAVDAQRSEPLDAWDVVWMAPFLSGGGYSSEALAFVGDLKTRVSHLTISQFAEQPSETFVEGLTDDYLDGLVSLTRSRAPSGARVLAICHSTPDVWVPSRYPGWDEIAPCPPPEAAITIGRTMYESDRLPRDWVERCNRLDEVWVPTRFHADSFARSGVDLAKLFVVPEPVDVAFFDPERVSALPLPAGVAQDGARKPFVFLSVFKWEPRKGWDMLLRAFLAEFSRAEPVLLLLKTTPFYAETDDFDSLVANFTRGLGLEPNAAAAVRVLSSELALSELPRLYRSADAFVLPSRGEGWGRPQAEAMAMGLATIATNWSGPTAFMTEANSYPVRVASLVPMQTSDEGLRAEGHLWAEPDVAHLRERMRWVYDHRDDAAAKGRRARADMVTHYSPSVVGAAVRERLAQLVAVDPAGRRRAASRDEL